MAWWVNEENVAHIARGLAAHKPDSAKRRKRDPYSKELLGLIRGQLDLASPLDAAVWACITTAFYGMARLGELTVHLRDVVFDPAVHALPAGVRENIAGHDTVHHHKVRLEALHG